MSKVPSYMTDRERLEQDHPLACNRMKWGEYNLLRCCGLKGHDGDCTYVVASKVPGNAEKMS